MRYSGSPKPAGPKRVLFVCIGNACRSQMAEAFARMYGRDCMVPASAGLAPAGFIARDTMRAMEAKHIEIDGQFSKGVRQLGRAEFDLVVNMTGADLPKDVFPGTKVVEWYVPDPIGLGYEEHCEVRDTIERRVMELILELRAQSAKA